jgi:hypothetical protein
MMPHEPELHIPDRRTLTGMDGGCPDRSTPGSGHSTTLDHASVSCAASLDRPPD